MRVREREMEEQQLKAEHFNFALLKAIAKIEHNVANFMASSTTELRAFTNKFIMNTQTISLIVVSFENGEYLPIWL